MDVLIVGSKAYEHIKNKISVARQIKVLTFVSVT